MDDEERQAEITRLTQVIEAGHDQEADRKTAEIMEKLDLQALTNQFHCTHGGKHDSNRMGW